MRTLRFLSALLVCFMLAAGSAFAAAQNAPPNADKFEAAIEAAKKKDFAGAKKILKPLADANDPVAQYFMGVMLIEESAGTGPKLKEAETWLAKAAKSGYPVASLQLATLYGSGKLGTADFKKARAELNKVIQSKIESAEYDLRIRSMAYITLGAMQIEGQGGPKEPQKGVDSFRKAANLGNPIAMMNLGRAYKLGIGVKQDNKQAKDWFTKAKTAGIPEAQQEIDALQ